MLVFLVLCNVAIDFGYTQQASCPSIEQIQLAQRVVTASIDDIDFTVTNSNAEISVDVDHPCGPGSWTRVAYLNMSDPSQQCPPNWMEFNTDEAGRTCGRPSSNGGSCLSAQYSSNSLEYNHVCGRIVGYQSDSPDAFGFRNNLPQMLDSFYVDGVSVTHGTPRQHIWTFAVGLFEALPTPESCSDCLCFCGNPNTTSGAPPPSFVGVNYFCESGNPTQAIFGGVHADDPLWDGINCPTNNCCDFNMPPWFNVQLPPTPTMDDIEVRICCDQDTIDENILVQLLEIYVSKQEVEP